jgi:hypothetical protein
MNDSEWLAYTATIPRFASDETVTITCPRCRHQYKVQVHPSACGASIDCTRFERWRPEDTLHVLTLMPTAHGDIEVAVLDTDPCDLPTPTMRAHMRERDAERVRAGIPPKNSIQVA